MPSRLPIVALVLALAAPATAQDARVWNFDDNPEAPALGFGAPDSDDVVIAFSCEPSAQANDHRGSGRFDQAHSGRVGPAQAERGERRASL